MSSSNGTLDTLDLGPDVGFVTVKIGDAERRLDLYMVQNRLYDAAEQTKGQPLHEYHAAVAALLAELGFPAVSHHAADRFVQAISDAAAGLRKND